LQPGGRITWRSIPLRELITQAFDLDPDPHAAIPGAPKWLQEARFDLIAKAPGNSAQLFAEDLRPMLRALLIERFQMRTHYEERPVDTYTLVAAKPKLKKADPANRPGCSRLPPQPPREPGVGPPPEVWVCQNVTLADFAARLQSLAKSYIRYPVLDATGIEGSWDFTLAFHPAPPPDGGPGRGGRGELEKGGDPTLEAISRISLFVAIERELGLKLQTQKRPARMLVIDHIEQKPTEN
jgi:uncharacterized protein (TIGR03435 family)